MTFLSDFVYGMSKWRQVEKEAKKWRSRKEGAYWRLQRRHFFVWKDWSAELFDSEYDADYEIEKIAYDIVTARMKKKLDN